MKTSLFIAVHKETLEKVKVIKVKRNEGVRYIVFWDKDPDPTVYLASEFIEKFYGE